MKQAEWQKGGICGALSSTSQQLNLEPSEQRERYMNLFAAILHGIYIMVHVNAFFGGGGGVCTCMLR